MMARLALAAVGLSSVLACGERAPEQLPPLGEVVVSIDTDAPVPELVGRLRVDMFDESGHWFEWGDVGRADVSDWPASFSLFTKDQINPRRVLLRARAYLEGRVRDYKGEQFQEREAHVEPKVASTLAELCDDLPVLELGRELTQRRGVRPLTGAIPEQPPPDAPSDWAPQCGSPMGGGNVAARLQIEEEGVYRIETTRLRPAVGAGDPVLLLRSDCREPLSQLACNDDIVSPAKTADDQKSRIVTHLVPGSYTVLVGGYLAGPSDVTLRADLEEDWQVDPIAPDPEEDDDPTAQRPRWLVDGRDITPPSEPQPLVTIDRLLLVTIVPGQKRIVSVVLSTACTGQMARLSDSGGPADPVLDEAETCIDVEGEREPLREAELLPFERLPSESRVGTFISGEPCPRGGVADDVVCMPAGHFVLGSADGQNSFVLPRSTLPERFAVMSRFWLDKTEVSVARWRTALARGFESPTLTPFEYNAPRATSDDDPLGSTCTFSAAPAPGGESREDFPLNCVDWYAARAFCRFEGGELPTEAQWEYATTKAGRRFETRFPWGQPGDAPSCEQAVAARKDSVGREESLCIGAGYGPAALTERAVANDATPLGVLDLAGNLTEWTLDSFASLSSPCWRAATLGDPLCWEEHAPERSSRGGSWNDSRDALAAFRGGFAPLGSNYTYDVPLGAGNIGFRCAYAEEPR